MQQSQLLKGALDLAVVAALADRESYGYEVLQRLTDAGLAGVGDASVYGVLKRLETMSVLSSQLVPSAEGPARRYYHLTATGKRWFNQSRREWIAFARGIENLIGNDRSSGK